MGALNRKNKNGYSLKISELDFDAPKIVKVKKNRKPLTVALIFSLLVMLFVPAVSYAAPIKTITCPAGEKSVTAARGAQICVADTASATTPAAGTTAGNREVSDSTCWLNEENEFANELGGMTAIQYRASSQNESNKTLDPTNEPTIRDRYGAGIEFTTWIPTVRNKDKIKDQKKIITVIPNALTWNNIGDTAWLTGSTTDLPPASSSTPIRQGEYIKDSGQFMNEGWCQIAMVGPTSADIGPNLIFNVAKGITNIATFLYVQSASGSNITDVFELNTDTVVTSQDQLFKTSANTSWTKAFGDEVNKILTGDGSASGKGLYDSLYLDFLLPVILIGALVVLINAIRSRALRALTGIIWMIAAIVGGMLFLQKPMFVPQLIDGIVGTITGSVNKAIIGDITTDGCAIPSDFAGWTDEKKREAKEMECYIWMNTIYIPWVEGTYGVEYNSAINDKTSALFTDPNGVLKTTTITLGTGTAGDMVLDPATNTASLGWPIYQLEYQNQPAAANVAHAQNALGDKTKWFSNGDEWGSAFLAFALAASSGIFIGINSTLIIAYQLVMLLLLLVAPLFLLIAIIPSRMGKGIGLRWAEMVVGIAIKRSVIAVMLAVFLKMFIIIAGIPNMSVGIQAILFGVLAYIGITQRAKIMEMFTGQVNFGGDKSISIGNGVESLGGKAGALLGGAALVGGGAALSHMKGGAKMAMVERRANKNQKELDAAGSNEEKLEILRQQEEKAEAKATKQALRKGNATVASAGRARLNRERSNVQFDVKEENAAANADMLGERLDLVNENVDTSRESLRRSVGYQGRTTRDKLDQSTSDIKDSVAEEGTATREDIQAVDSNVDTSRESLRDSVGYQGRKTREDIRNASEETNDNIDASRESLRGSVNNQGRKTREKLDNNNDNGNDKPNSTPPTRPPRR